MKKILILGSGGLRIGQAGEFDYSGSQAIKALKEEGITTVLVNPNIATVQTDPDMADRVYLQPLNLSTVSEILEKERPDGIFLGFGGQTALNLGLELAEKGILDRFSTTVLGTSVASIRIAEDRQLFKEALSEIEVKTARSFACNSVDDALAAAAELKYPVMLRSGYSLGGLGSGKMTSPDALAARVKETLSYTPQVLIEEYLFGWKEVEYEIIRDQAGNALTVCNMENLDPMGIHTGESIVVAPSQTLTNTQYHMLREVALRTAHHLNIIGECNIQYALDPQSDEYRVIELNPRLSRSSALASKATGYPLAFVAAKLALGHRLDAMRNQVTGETSAFFEPALDYVVVKIPRWDIHKLKVAERTIGSEMKSVGEVMGIGRTFGEALQKAIRMLNIGAQGLTDHGMDIDHPASEIAQATDRRLYALADHLAAGATVEALHQASQIDRWFLHHLKQLVALDRELTTSSLSPELLRRAKIAGFCDATIETLTEHPNIRELRKEWNIVPYVKQIDTLAGEFATETNYLYLTYLAEEHDLKAPNDQAALVVGSGPYCIGSSVEFDWCAVNTARTLRKLDVSAVIINSNPETVSTDYDESDRLYFEELTLERIQDIADFETPRGLIVSVGGQIANTLACQLDAGGYPLLGTPAAYIDQAENRQKFSSLLNELGVDQPEWEEVTTLARARAFATRVGYPILVRPSYVLSGAAMNVVAGDEELEAYLNEATQVSQDHPVVMSQFITDARELEIDGVACQGEVVIDALSEHVENAGVHSGDATLVLPPQRLYLETIRKARAIARQIARALCITGPFNLQLIAKEGRLKVIECNVRASRSFPFVSKVTNTNFIDIATRILLDRYTPKSYRTLDLDYVGVKSPQFSYHRLKGSNPVAHVEMASTGEVACLGDSFFEAFFSSWLATEQSIRSKRLLVSIGGERKERLIEQLCLLDQQGWELWATDGTQHYLARHGMGRAT